MSWPSDQDYNEAIQNPRLAFSDAELQVGQVELGALGIPKARSGNFAAVYKVVCSSASHAVRCFRYDNPENAARYPAIASYLGQTRPPYMVSFRYLSQGIRVSGKWYPILKMRWIEGDSLTSYVEKNLSNPIELRRLAAAWRTMLKDLKEANIAHGDLQHGNVLIVQGSLRLVDYDGMYVPALSGSCGLELGHRNYQHPQRSSQDFGPYLDNFSGWLIYASLLALAADSALWRQLKAGDECLLFRSDDLLAPDTSDAFHLLKTRSDAQVQCIINQIENFLWLPLKQIPSLSESQDWEEQGIRVPVPAGSSSWIDDYIAASNAPEKSDTVPGDAPFDPRQDKPWIHDHLDQHPSVTSFTNDVRAERLISLIFICSTALVCYWLSFRLGIAWQLIILPGCLGITCALVVLWCRIRYLREPICGEICAVQAELSVAEQKAANAMRELEQLKLRRKQKRDLYGAESSRIQQQMGSLKEKESAKLRQINAALQASLSEINSRRRAVIADEGSEKQKLADSIGGRISKLARDIAAQDDEERRQLDALQMSIQSLEGQLHKAISDRDRELQGALREYQDQIVNSHLHRFRIHEASIPGIGPELKRRLAEAGYVSAGDIGTRGGSMPGIGAKGIGATRRDALYNWRRTLEAQIRAREVPPALPGHKRVTIEQRHEGQITHLQQRLAIERPRVATEIEWVQRKYAEEKSRLAEQKALDEKALKLQTESIEKRFNDSRNRLSSEEQAARLQSQKRSEECQVRFQSAAKESAASAAHLKETYESELRNVQKELGAAGNQMRQTAWDRDRLSHKVAVYKPYTFRRYALRIVGM